LRSTDTADWSIAARTSVAFASSSAAMSAKSLAMFLADLGVTKTHSRPHVSDGHI
jgi:hypothetical protein